jgi:hypothetical protein
MRGYLSLLFTVGVSLLLAAWLFSCGGGGDGGGSGTDTNAGVTVTESGGATNVSEDGSTDDYTIVLDSQPGSTVTITVTPDAQTDLGSGQGTAITLTFTAANWDSVQTVTVAAVDDGTVEGPHNSTITHASSSSDSNYNGNTISSVTVNISDNDIASAANVVFVTSVTGDGNLGSWADAGGNTGLAAGDAICQARAVAAGLTGTFVAWLSDDNNDAYCRVHNLTGKKASNCGQGSLPASAGPWVRTDDFPFGPRIDQILSPNGVVYTPLRFDEFGDPVSDVIPGYFTATFIDGTFDIATTCSNWTSNGTELAIYGDLNGTTGTWTSAGDDQCQSNFHLLCFQTDAGGSLPSFASSGKKVFVTSLTGNGNLGSWPDSGGNTGLAAGDAICQARASAAGLANTANFKAWLSGSATDAIDRLTSDGPWVRPDGVKVADNKADLTDGSLFTAISQDETGIYWDNRAVWTGTFDTGIKTSDTCNDWTDGTNAFNGIFGTSTFAGNDWSGFTSSLSCDSTFVKLYCFED